jgi:hypothetical protein
MLAHLAQLVARGDEVLEQPLFAAAHESKTGTLLECRHVSDDGGDRE